MSNKSMSSWLRTSACVAPERARWAGKRERAKSRAKEKLAACSTLTTSTPRNQVVVNDIVAYFRYAAHILLRSQTGECASHPYRP